VPAKLGHSPSGLWGPSWPHYGWCSGNMVPRPVPVWLTPERSGQRRFKTRDCSVEQARRFTPTSWPKLPKLPHPPQDNYDRKGYESPGDWVNASSFQTVAGIRTGGLTEACARNKGEPLLGMLRCSIGKGRLRSIWLEPTGDLVRGRKGGDERTKSLSDRGDPCGQS